MSQTTSQTFKDPRKPRTNYRGSEDLAKLFGSLPPHAIEAEASLLGSVLLEPQVTGDIVQIIRGPNDFYRPAHGAIYQAMIELYDERGTLDIVQLHQMLLDRRELEDVGGVNYLAELADSVPTAAHVEYYANIVREKAMVRQLIGAASDILHDAYTSQDEGRSLLDRAEKLIYDITEQSDRSDFATLSRLIQETMAQIENNEGKHITGVATGYSKLDEMTSGLQSDELIILAARPSMGKTSLALNLAEQIAMRGEAVGFFSLEMSRQQLVQRLLCARAGIDSQRLRRNMLRSEDYRALMAACSDLEDAPIYIDDTPALTVLQLRAKARRMATKFGIKVIFIDYLQLLTTGSRTESRQVEVSEISRAIKAMARELKVPVVCLSQLNRAAEQREGHRPRMSDLRESGSIEQDADVIAMLHKEEYYHRQDSDWKIENPDKVGVAELIIAKQRNGPTGVCYFTWDEASMRFKDHSPATPPEGYYDGGRDHDDFPRRSDEPDRQRRPRFDPDQPPADDIPF